MNTIRKTLALMPRMVIVAAISIAGITSTAFGQMAAEPLRPGTMLAQAMPPSTTGGAMGPNQGMQPAQPGAMPQGMEQDMMHGGMMAGRSGAMPMQGQMMKFMIVMIDADGDGALSFEEISILHKRIFDHVDANKDGKVTLEEAQSFMRD